MSSRRKIDIDAIGNEMGAVAAFARGALTEVDPPRQGLRRPKLVSSLVAVASSPLPHERRTILEGEFDIAVGWDREPVIESQANAAAIRIVRTNGRSASPPEAVEETLKVRVRHGVQSREFPLRTVSGQRGYYVADLIPTRPGDYEFTLLGTIEGRPVEERFASGAGSFSGVQPAADVQFPVRMAEAAQLAADRPEVRPATQTSQALVAVGLGLGLFGVLAALTSWRGRSAPVSLPAALKRAEHRPEEQQHLTGPSNGKAGPPEGLGDDFGPTLQRDIALALQPLVAEFRQDLVGELQEQTRQVFQPSVRQRR